ncbi:zinc finger protein 277-like protein [Leptotrombidium deliense]|uniref:Zinc finger protein 277-like protein n=1 Tax=Leptotrombidium deliense TaxID=299467 RepID=A0A443SMB1_9ACAR|nr:zinc finger protein 277-like protein [Leptotrombidium deliense]
MNEVVNKVNSFQCILCETDFHYKTAKFDPKAESSKIVVEKFKQHLLLSHKLLISDVYEIPNLIEYLNHWRNVLKDRKELRDFCAVIKTNSKPDDVGESEILIFKKEYFMLCPDVLREEKALREKLHANRLQEILEIQQNERKDESFSRQCLFCKKVFSGNIRTLINHLAIDHNFTFGHPDNLVFVGELLDLIDSKINQSICLFCEKVFKDRDTLKEHMRKKHHKRLNPHNKEYDKYYVVNYLESASKQKNKEICDEAVDDTGEENENENWEDWKEENVDCILCLFCENNYSDISAFVQHLKEMHHFDWNILQTLNFYEKVKFVNFVRKCIDNKVCIHCQQQFDSSSNLLHHINSENESSTIPDKQFWDLPEHYFPVHENDSLLSVLQDNNDDESENVEIIAE